MVSSFHETPSRSLRSPQTHMGCLFGRWQLLGSRKTPSSSHWRLTRCRLAAGGQLATSSRRLLSHLLFGLQESITAKACYSSDKVHENTRVTTTMGAGTGAAPGQAPPDLPSLLLDGRICYIGMPVSPSPGLIPGSHRSWQFCGLLPPRSFQVSAFYTNMLCFACS